jgi:uncharacterized repeat protein (TIGR03803 family)
MKTFFLRLGALSMLALSASLNSVHASSLIVLHAFHGGSDGSFPESSLIRDPAGNLYGTTNAGGGGPCNNGQGCGTVFKVLPDGTTTVLHAMNGTDGENLLSGLLRDGSNLYGTATFGGLNTCGGPTCGTVFKIAGDGTFTGLHDFSGYPTDGAQPLGALLKSASGIFFGVTQRGGGSQSCSSNLGCGTIFEINKYGPEAVRYHFLGGADGISPMGPMVSDSSGNLYGVTQSGGNSDCQCSGTIWKFAPDGTHTVLYSFSGGSDGSTPNSGLISDSAGNLYGVTAFAGNLSCSNGLGCGTVFKLAMDGTLNVLHQFSAGSDGKFPAGILAIDKKGNIFGETSSGGGNGCSGNGCGTLFEITPTGLYGVVYNFSGLSDGSSPSGGLIKGKGKVLYGVTTVGGDSTCNDGGGCGTVFKFTR